MYKIKIPSFLLCLLFVFQLGAQSYTLEGISSVSSNGIKPIMNGKEVSGYVVFYKKDKKDSKNDNYGFDLVDEKLNKVSSVKVVLPTGSVFLQSVYNGEALGLMFYDPYKKNYIFKSYDKKLTLLGSRITEKPNKWEQATLNQMDGADTDEVFYFYGIRPVPGKGFVRTGYGKSSDQFKVTMYDNNFKEKWAYETPKTAKGYEVFMLSDINTQYVTGMTLRRNGLLSHKFDFFLTIFNADTGEKMVDVSVEKPNQNLSISATILQEGSDELMLQGEFYDMDAKPMVHKSKGFYLKTFELKTGKETGEHLYSWDKDVAKLFDAKAKESIEDKYLNYPLSLFKTANGHFYMVFEQYKKVADGAGIAMRALGGETSVAKVKVGNMWLLEMDADLNPLAIQYYEKDGSSVKLPPGTDMAGTGLAGFVIKWIGGFDYQFLQQSNDGAAFNIAYINYDREKGSKTKTIVGNIFLPKDGTLSFDKVDITAPKNTVFYLYPAQGNAVMVSQFLKKEKTLEFKLVKLNY